MLTSEWTELYHALFQHVGKTSGADVEGELYHILSLDNYCIRLELCKTHAFPLSNQD